MAPGLRAENVPVPQWGDAGDRASGGGEMLLQGKVAIVTGGDSGIGRAIAVGLAGAGASVTINYHSNQQAAEDVRQQIEHDGGKALIVQGNVATVADLQRLVDETVRQFGRMDIMVNNAGMETRTSVLDTTEADYDRVLAVDLKGAFFGTQLAAKQMLKQGGKGGGRIINISSVHEDWPMPGNTPYCCAKGGMRMLIRTAGVELAPHGITVVGVGPGAVDTPINKETLADPEKQAALNHAIPLGRVAEPEEIANLVVWLASDQAGYVTATTYFIDGGIMQGSVGL
jgi:glucose 1-dehydrogenase